MLAAGPLFTRLGRKVYKILSVNWPRDERKKNNTPTGFGPLLSQKDNTAQPASQKWRVTETTTTTRRRKNPLGIESSAYKRTRTGIGYSITPIFYLFFFFFLLFSYYSVVIAMIVRRVWCPPSSDDGQQITREGAGRRRQVKPKCTGHRDRGKTEQQRGHISFKKKSEEKEKKR